MSQKRALSAAPLLQRVMAKQSDLRLRAETLLESTRDAYERGNIVLLSHYAAKLLEVAEQLDELALVSKASNYLGTAEVYAGRAESAHAFFDRAYEGYQKLGDSNGMVRVLLGRGVIASDINQDYGESRAFFDQALQLSRDANDDTMTAFSLANLGEASRLDSDSTGAIRYARESLVLFEKLDDQAHAASQLTNIAHYLVLRREYVPATAALRQAYQKLRKHQRFLEIAWYLEIWFFIACELRRSDDAGKLLGFIENYRDEHSIPRLPAMMPWYAPRLERLEQQLGYEAFARLKRQGELLTLAQANAITETFD